MPSGQAHRGATGGCGQGRRPPETYLERADATEAVAPEMKTGENVARDPYRDIAQSADENSGQRTDRVVGLQSHWSDLKPAARKRVDTEVMAFAKKLQKAYSGVTIRPDEARMLEILASSGASGLERARGSGVVLPALAALGFVFTEGEES